jgi:glutathione synthase/RimK-type ligase-like ATP-grasp enzyme
MLLPTILFISLPEDVHSVAVQQHIDPACFNVCFVGYDFSQIQSGLLYLPLQDTVMISPDPVLNAAYAQSVQAVYYRKNMGLQAYSVDEQFTKESFNQYVYALGTFHQDAFWLINPYEHGSCRLKAFQLQQAVQEGINIPPTFIGNSQEGLSRFIEAQGYDQEFIVKPLTSQPIVTQELAPFWSKSSPQYTLHPLSTTKVDANTLRNHFSALNAPLICQAYIPKQYEVRVTYVAGKVFACRIDSQVLPETQVDWRSEVLLDQVPHTMMILPDSVERQLVSYMERLGLHFGCLDYIVTPEGDYYFLEVNVDGHWLWIERLTGAPISQAIANALCNPPADVGG